MGKARWVGQRGNDVAWKIDERMGLAFEKAVAEYVRLAVPASDDTISWKATKAAHDGGRDIVIHAKAPFHLFGLRIDLPVDRAAVRVNVEIKSSSSDRLSDEFLADCAQVANDPPDVHILVTNATVTPRALCDATDAWRKLGATFLVSDRWLLARTLIDAGMRDEFARRGLTLPNESEMPPRPTGLLVEFQYDRESFCSDCRITLHLAFHNPTDDFRRATLRLASERSWEIDGQTDFEIIISPGHKVMKELVCTLRGDERFPLTLAIASSGKTEAVTIRNARNSLPFEPQLVGAKHLSVRNSIYDILAHEQACNIISVCGYAGMGKSRVIDESLRSFRSSYRICKIQFAQKTDPSDSLHLAYLQLDERSEPPELTVQPFEHRLAHLVQTARNVTRAVVYLEDLHHASSATIRAIRHIVERQVLQGTSAYLILTARNDHTFPNDEYFSLLSYLSSRTDDEVFSEELVELSEQDATNLIASIVSHAPDGAIDRIYELAERTPYVIVSVIQHLVDVRLARLASRRTVSIIDSEKFNRPDSIPPTVLALHEARFSALLSSEAGRATRDLLVVLSFFGFEIDVDLCRSVVDARLADSVWRMLLERRFATLHDDGRVTFWHENLFHFIIDWVRRPPNRLTAATLLLRFPALVGRLSQHDRGYVHWLAGDADTAWNDFGDIWTRIVDITNFSAEQIDKSYFPYLEPLFDVACALNAPQDDVVKICQAMAYMGIHNFPIPIGIAACEAARHMLQRHPQRRSIAREIDLSLRQLEAHGLLNRGKSLLAYQKMLEIEAEVADLTSPAHELKFDLYDRLQEYYRKANHAHLSERYQRLARRAAEASMNDRLMTAHLITVSVSRLYGTKDRALATAGEAHAHAIRTGVYRFEVYTRLTQLVAIALHAVDRGELETVYHAARNLLSEAQAGNLSDSIMRCELLLATLSLYVVDDEREAVMRASRYANSGLSDSLRFGNGLFDWAFHNLLGVINSPSMQVTEEARRRFRSCLEVLKLRGLTFLGACDGCYPNIYALSNILRAFLGYEERMAEEVVAHISVYDSSALEASTLPTIYSSARGGAAILMNSRRQALKLRYPLDGGFFTPIF